MIRPTETPRIADSLSSNSRNHWRTRTCTGAPLGLARGTNTDLPATPARVEPSTHPHVSEETMNSKRFTTLAAAVTLAAGVAVGTAVPASASHGGGGKERNGSCSQGASWKIKAKADDGAIEVEAEVDTN